MAHICKPRAEQSTLPWSIRVSFLLLCSYYSPARTRYLVEVILVVGKLRPFSISVYRGSATHTHTATHYSATPVSSPPPTSMSSNSSRLRALDKCFDNSPRNWRLQGQHRRLHRVQDCLVTLLWHRHANLRWWTKIPLQVPSRCTSQGQSGADRVILAAPFWTSGESRRRNIFGGYIRMVTSRPIRIIDIRWRKFQGYQRSMASVGYCTLKSYKGRIPT